MSILRFRVTGNRDAIDAIVARLSRIDELERVEEVDDEMPDVRERPEMSARDVDAAIEFVERF